MDHRYDIPNKLNKLVDELVAAGILPTFVEGDSEGTTVGTWVRIAAPGNQAPVDTVVAAHDPSTPSAAESLTAADQQSIDAFHLGWVLGQARLGNVGANAIQNQMDTIQAAQIGTVAAAAVHLKTLSEAVEDLARQLRVLKRTVAIGTQAPDRLGG